jgi:hypothetical protein
MKRREFITLLRGTPGIANSDTRAAIHAKDGHDSWLGIVKLYIGAPSTTMSAAKNSSSTA